MMRESAFVAQLCDPSSSNKVFVRRGRMWGEGAVIDQVDLLLKSSLGGIHKEVGPAYSTEDREMRR